jgi:hypothetical protein
MMADIIERLATCARKLLGAGAEIENLLMEKGQLIDTLTELHAAVVGISKHTGAELTDDSVAAWLRLNDAQARAAAITLPFLSHPESQQGSGE